MNLTTRYLGMELKNPLVAGASPLSKEAGTVRELEDAGVSAVVMYSLFEEQIEHDATLHDHYMEYGADSFAEALSYVPQQVGFSRGPDEYIEHVAALKAAVDIPIIASINGTSKGGWIEYARQMEQAGADAIELNLYYVAADPDTSARDIEERYLEVVREVKATVGIPVAVKIGASFSALANFARQLDQNGADGLVMFNRFYQPDIDIEELDVVPKTGGAHNAVDVIKAVMAGAHTVQLVSALLIHGPDHVKRTLEAVEFWMGEHEYESMGQMCGSMNVARTPNPKAYARANYMKMLDSWEH
jgi:dihydroorotate dehydrogenase (fumarate)